MIWLFWSLVALVVIGLPILALLARWNRSPLRPAGPTSRGLMREAGRTFLDVLWATSHPFGRVGWHRREAERKDEARGDGLGG